MKQNRFVKLVGLEIIHTSANSQNEIIVSSTIDI